MTKSEALRNGFRKVAKEWIKTLEKDFQSHKVYDAISEVIKHSGAGILDEDYVYSAGLMWHQYYDLIGAARSELIKIEHFIEWFIEVIAEEFEANVEDIYDVYQTKSSESNQYIIFFKFYNLFDPNFDARFNATDAAIIGFENISNIISNHSVLRELLENWNTLVN